MNHPHHFISIFIILILISVSLTPLLKSSSDLPSGQISENEVMQSNIASDIRIDDIQGGLQLKITVNNTGSITYHNIRIQTEISNGLIFTPRIRTFTIPVLQPNSASSSYTMQNQIMGIGINPFNYPHINIFINQSGTLSLIGQVDAFIIGPFIKITNQILNDENSFQGYTLFSPEYTTNTYLINNDGDIEKTWRRGNINGMASYLLDNGNLICTDISETNPYFPVTNLGGATGHVGIIGPYGENIWDFTYSNDQYRLHHDIEPLPNGNILMIAWEHKTEAEAIAAGRNPQKLTQGKLFPDHIIEVQPTGQTTGEIVWEWHVWDHLIQDHDPDKANYGVIRNHPELIDINYPESDPDFTHINSIDYHPQLDQILLSVRYYNEIWVIDHSTTTEEAAGHSGGRYGKGGDLLYRWGNPAAYDAGTSNDQQLFQQHDATWIPKGYPGEDNIILFNNNHEKIDEHNPNLRFYSSVDEIIPPIDNDGHYFKVGAKYGPISPTWTYTADNIYTFFSGHLSSAQRLPNGNTLICEGAKGKMFEITPDHNIVWEYTNTFGIPNHVFHIHRYAEDDEAIQNLLD